MRAVLRPFDNLCFSTVIGLSAGWILILYEVSSLNTTLCWGLIAAYTLLFAQVLSHEASHRREVSSTFHLTPTPSPLERQF